MYSPAVPCIFFPYPESFASDLVPRFLGDLTGIDTKSSVPYIKEFFFLFLAGIPLLFNANPLADDFFDGAV